MDFTRRVTHAYAIPHEAPIRDGGVRSPVRLLNRDAVPSSAQHFSLKLYLILVFLVGICPAHAQSAATPKPLPASGATDRQRSILCGSARGDNRESFEACARGTGQHHKRPPLFQYARAQCQLLHVADHLEVPKRTLPDSRSDKWCRYSLALHPAQNHSVSCPDWVLAPLQINDSARGAGPVTMRTKNAVVG